MTTRAQNRLLGLLHEVGHGEPVSLATLKKYGIRRPTVDAAEAAGKVFTRYVETGAGLEPCVVRVTPELLESHGLVRSEENPEVWVTVRPGVRRFVLRFVHGNPSHRWVGTVYFRGDEASAGTDTIFGLIDTLQELAEPEGGR